MRVQRVSGKMPVAQIGSLQGRILSGTGRTVQAGAPRHVARISRHVATNMNKTILSAGLEVASGNHVARLIPSTSEGICPGGALASVPFAQMTIAAAIHSRRSDRLLSRRSGQEISLLTIFRR